MRFDNKDALDSEITVGEGGRLRWGFESTSKSGAPPSPNFSEEFYLEMQFEVAAPHLGGKY